MVSEISDVSPKPKEPLSSGCIATLTFLSRGDALGFAMAGSSESDFGAVYVTEVDLQVCSVFSRTPAH